MRVSAALVAITALLAGPAAAADLTQADFAVIKATFGLSERGQILSGLSGEERERLHDVLTDQRYGPEAQRANASDLLFGAYNDQCRAWSARNAGSLCPPAPDPKVRPGQNIADLRCNSCHLIGSTTAPPFFKVASRVATPAQLSEALTFGHRLAPLTFSSEQLDQLVAYLTSLTTSDWR